MFNLIKKSGVAIAGSALLLAYASTTVFALPPKPGKPSLPSQASQPQFPAQPELPPCAECDEFLNEPTPSPKASIEPTASTSSQSNGSSSSSSDNDDDDDNGVGGGEEVLGLSATSSNAVSALTVFGFICLGIGVKLMGRRLQKTNA